MRSQLACSARRLPAAEALTIVRALLAHREDADDIHMPLLIWWAIEAQVSSDPGRVLALFDDPSIWGLPIVRRTVAERVMRRFAAAGSRADLDRCARLLAMAPGPDDARRLMTGFEAAYAGRSLAGLPEALAGAMAKYGGHSLTIGLRQRKPEATAEALRLLSDERGDHSKMIEVLTVLGEVPCPPALPVLLKLAAHSSDNALRTAALAALAAYDDPKIAAEVLAAYPQMSDDVQSAALGLLATRRNSAGRLLDAIENRTIDAKTFPRELAERMVLLNDPDLSARLTRLLGPIRPATPADLRAEVDRLAAASRSGSGVPKPGKALFDRTCARCHTLFGKGGTVGPDLTTYRRDDLDTILLNVVNPSAEIREGFATSIIATTDGRILTGVTVEQDKNVVVLRVEDGRNLTIARDDIEAIKPGTRSLMPEGLLKGLSDQEIRDLLAYLRSSQPLID